MNDKKAFPHITVDGGDNYRPPTRIHHPGISFREYIATQTLAALIARAPPGCLSLPISTADDAVQYADALIERLKK